MVTMSFFCKFSAPLLYTGFLKMEIILGIIGELFGKFLKEEEVNFEA